MHPEFITHYYLPSKKPFLSLSELEGNTEHPIFQEMLNLHKTNQNYNRRYGLNYLRTRTSVEEKLRALFINHGGMPKSKYPIYFVLGESKWFKHLNSEHVEIKIPITDLPSKSVSLTFPDSYIAMTNENKSYFEQVYFIEEAKDVLSKHGIPSDKIPESYNKYWEGDFELYYEVQVWDLEFLNHYFEKPC